MLVKKNISKIILLFILLLSLNVITVLLGDSNSTVTVVNKTEYFINAVIDGKSYPDIGPDLGAVHTMRAKPSVLVVAAYSPGQEVEGLAERTLTLPYSGGNEICKCDDEGDPHCVTNPIEGGSARWDVTPYDLGQSQNTQSKGSVWINDLLLAEDIDLVEPSNFNDFCILGTNWTGTGISIAFFDDIKVLDYSNPEFSDNFEGYPTGSYPSANWVTRFDGLSALVSTEKAHSDSQSFQLVSYPTFARVEAYVLPTTPDSIVYEGWVNIYQADRGIQIGFGKKISSSTYSTFNKVTFANDNKIYFNGSATEYLIPWSPNTWYKIKVKCKFGIAKQKADLSLMH